MGEMRASDMIWQVDKLPADECTNGWTTGWLNDRETGKRARVQAVSEAGKQSGE